jgi:hypothetical protein
MSSANTVRGGLIVAVGARIPVGFVGIVHMLLEVRQELRFVGAVRANISFAFVGGFDVLL